MSNIMDISKINLNLLLILDVLLQGRNLSEAAKALNISQPSVSKNFKMLKIIFSDELLISDKNKNQIILTDKALMIRPALSKFLKSAENLISNNARFIPYTAQNTFFLATGDIVAYYLLPQIDNMFSAIAPKSSISLDTLDSFIEQDMAGIEEKDIIICLNRKLPLSMTSEILFESGLTCLIGKNNALSKRKMLDMKDLVDYRHIIITHNKEKSSLNLNPEKYKKILGFKENMQFVQVPYGFSAIELVRKCNCVWIGSSAIMKKIPDEFGLISLPLKTDIKLSFLMCWSKKKHNMEYHRWLRKITREGFYKAFELETIGHIRAQRPEFVTIGRYHEES